MCHSDHSAAELPPKDELTPAEGRYLCGVLYRSLRAGPPVTNRELTDLLGVSGASVTGMSKTLADEGLLTHERYHGVTLTARGDRLARRLLWQRCAVEQCFADRLGIDLLAEQAARIATELDAAQIDSLGDCATLPCTSRCEATAPADCDQLRSTDT
ncbi:metal-dependent transcriptional regulator [Halalkalirubrum salinum]|uniref:metal-dependent transcriptional regulator n=1 Tax=Halalkalirubrum salinum TaxID=2563889 RepID=UPI0010FB4D8F|nr:metal-dependent transcriptional regulator [Halalkalirubrum salinum]